MKVRIRILILCMMAFVPINIFALVASNNSAAEKTITLNYQNIPVRSALQILAEFSGENIVANDDVQGNITLQLKNVTWQQALDIILKSQRLTYEKLNNAYLITPIATLEKFKQQQLQTQQNDLTLEPLQSKVFNIKYGNADEIAKTLKDDSNRILSSRGNIGVDASSNSLWIEDTAENIAQISKLITQLDKQAKQVLIEARVVNVDKHFEKDLGIRWHVNYQTGNSNIAMNAFKQMTSEKNQYGYDFPQNAENSNAPNLGVALANLNAGVMLDLELSALESEGDANIIASPRIVTTNDQEALIQSGEDIPFQRVTKEGATAVTFKKAVLSLQVKPQITPNNQILLHLTVNQDKRGPEVLPGVPSIDTRSLQTQVLVNNGDTIVLGGILQESKGSSVERIPFFGELPIIGHLFRQQHRDSDDRELLIFVTTKILQENAL